MKITRPVKITFIILLNFFICLAATAQNTTSSKIDSIQTKRAQSVFIEVAGPGLFFSANYDTRFSQQRNGLGARIGIGFLPSSSDHYITLPVQLNYLFGKRSNFFEAGIGATLVYSSFLRSPDYYMGGNETYRVNSFEVVGSTTLGYRYQPVNGGFNFRASFNPLFIISNYSYNGGIQFGTYGGVSFGYTFK